MQELETLFAWENVKTFLREKYKVTKETDDMMVFTFSFSDKRSQVTFVSKNETGSGRETVEVVSRIGEIVPKRLNAALETTAKTIVGGMVKINEDYFVRSTVWLKGLVPEILDEMMDAVTATADELEKEFVGGDEN